MLQAEGTARAKAFMCPAYKEFSVARTKGARLMERAVGDEVR